MLTANATPATNELQIVLDNMVHELARQLNAQVSSVYCWKANENVLELLATHGLNKELVGQLRLRPDQGLTGLVAETRKPVSVKNPAKHPRYILVPRSFEERLQSYLGVPIFQTGRQFMGVLTVQSEATRIFSGDEIGAVVSTANRVAELLPR